MCHAAPEIWRQTEFPAETYESDSQTLPLGNLTALGAFKRGDAFEMEASPVDANFIS